MKTYPSAAALPAATRTMHRLAAAGVVAVAVVVAMAAAGAPGAARADDAAGGLRVQSLAATCAACHGSAGQAVDDATVPGLAGLPAAAMVEQMRAFRSGSRPATVMHQIAKGYSEAQIAELAGYFAAQPAATGARR